MFFNMTLLSLIAELDNPKMNGIIKLYNDLCYYYLHVIEIQNTTTSWDIILFIKSNQLKIKSSCSSQYCNLPPESVHSTHNFTPSLTIINYLCATVLCSPD